MCFVCNTCQVRFSAGKTLTQDAITSIYDRVVSHRGAKERLARLGSVAKPTLAQEREIAREEERAGRSRWLLDFGGKESPFPGVDEEYYTSLVEWTGRTIREDKPGYIPVELKSVLDRYGLDAAAWAENVEAYGSLFHRIAGSAERMLSFALERGQSWFRGRNGSDQLYASAEKVA